MSTLNVKATASLDEDRIVVDPNSDVMGCYGARFARLYPGLHYEPHLGAILSYPFIAPFGRAALFLLEVGNEHFALEEKRQGVDSLRVHSRFQYEREWMNGR